MGADFFHEKKGGQKSLVHEKLQEGGEGQKSISEAARLLDSSD